MLGSDTSKRSATEAKALAVLNLSCTVQSSDPCLHGMVKFKLMSRVAHGTYLSNSPREEK